MKKYGKIIINTLMIISSLTPAFSRIEKSFDEMKVEEKKEQLFNQKTVINDDCSDHDNDKDKPIVNSQKIEKVKESDSEYSLRDIWNFFQKPFGKALSPSELNTSINRNFIDNSWTKGPMFTSEYGSVKYPMFHEKFKGIETKTIITAPAHDIDMSKDVTHGKKIDAANAGGLSIKTVIDSVITHNKTGKVEVLTPVAQSNSYFFGLIKREHWTTLKTTIEDGKITDVTHIDSKGVLSRLYNAKEKIKAQLPSNAPEVKTIYTGHQGVCNNTDCGRFSQDYINNLAKGSKPEELALEKTKSIWSRFF